MALPNQLIQQDRDKYAGTSTPDPLAPSPLDAAPVPPPAPPVQAAPAPVAPLPQPGQFGTNPINPMQTPGLTADVFARRAQAEQNIAQEDIGINNDLAAAYDKGSAFTQDVMAQQKAEMEAGKAEADRRAKAMDEAIARGRTMSVDPQRYWNKQGTGLNILSAIAIGLGSFGSGMTKGATGNPAMELITRAIDNDIKSQQSDIDSYWRSVQQQFQVDDSVWNKSLAKQQFYTNYMQSGLRVTQMEVAAMQAKSANPEVKRKLADMNMALETKQIELQEKSGSFYAEMIRQQKAAQAAAAGARRVDADKRNAMVKDLVTSQVAQGIPADEAMRNALQQTDDLFPQLKGTQFASPGQNYQAMQDQLVAGYVGAQNTLNSKDKSVAAKAKADMTARYMAAGLSKDQAEKKIALIQKASVNDFRVAAQADMDISGVANPYAGTGTLSSSDPRVVTDPNGKLFRFPSKEAAKEYGERAAGSYEFARLADELLALRTRQGGGFSTILNPTDAAKEDAIRSKMAAAWAKANGGGNALSDKEFDRAMSIIPKASNYNMPWSVDPAKAIASIKQLALDANKSNIEGLGGKSYGAQGTPGGAVPVSTGGGSAVPARPKGGSSSSSVPAKPTSAGPTSAAPPTGPTAAKGGSSGPTRSSEDRLKDEIAKLTGGR